MPNSPSIRSVDLDGPFNGLAAKIKFIKHCYRESLRDPRLRQLVEELAGRGDRLTQAKRLYKGLVDRFAYLPDPVGVELTKSPSVMLNELGYRKQFSGDCDDAACMSYAALQAMGLPAKLRVVWFEGSDQPRHIYTVADIMGRDIPFDIANKHGFGAEPEYTKKVDF
jgi:transglutaminase-like putative cysteine protease